jgi:hypothetical protein
MLKSIFQLLLPLAFSSSIGYICKRSGMNAERVDNLGGGDCCLVFMFGCGSSTRSHRANSIIAQTARGRNQVTRPPAVGSETVSAL